MAVRVIASIPRSGSTYLWRAILGYPPGTTSPKAPGWKKIHEIIQDYDKAIFLFSDPVHAEISYKKKRKQKIRPYEELFDYWSKAPRTMCIRYEAMPKYFNRISRFLGVKINFPPWKPRKIYYKDSELKKKYSSLIRKMVRDMWINK